MMSLEDKIYHRMLDSRMNKYYHQSLAFWTQCIVYIFLFGCLVCTLLVLVANFHQNYLLSVFAALLVVAISTNSVIQHHVLVTRFNFLEGEYTDLNTRVDVGNTVTLEDFITLEAKYSNLESMQGSAIKIILKNCDTRVRMEVGEGEKK